jgi:hypothetical protein
VLLVATLFVVVLSSLGLVRFVILYLLKIFVIEKILFSELLSPFFSCLSSFEYHPGCLWEIWVLWQHYVISSVYLTNGEFFLSCYGRTS